MLSKQILKYMHNKKAQRKHDICLKLLVTIDWWHERTRL